MMARRRLWLAAVVVAVAGGEDDALACPCGLGDAPWPERGPQDLALHYLHVPKAGTSWAVTMARVPAACGGVSSSGLASAMRACVAAGTNLQETCMFEVLQSRSRKCMRAAASVRPRKRRPIGRRENAPAQTRRRPTSARATPRFSS